MSAKSQTDGAPAEVHDDPFRHTSLVPYFDLENGPADIAAKLKVLPFRRNIFLLLGHSHGIGSAFSGLVSGCFNGQVRKIPLLDWNLIVLRTSSTLKAKYEYDVNLPVSEIFGLGQDKIDAVRWSTPENIVGGYGPFSERQRLILRIVDEQLATYSNKEETIKDALKVLSTEDLIEILIILGIYATIARIINAVKIDDDQPIRPEGLTEGLLKSISKNSNDE